VRRAALSLGLLLWGGCVPKQASVPGAAGDDDDGARFHLTIIGEFATTGLEDRGPDVAALMAPVTFSLDLQVRTEPSRVFRDGSLGQLVVVEAATGWLSRPGEAAPVEVPTALAGRSIELRTFEDGELLDATMVEHLVGFGRYGDVFDLILPVLTPAPPTVSSERDVVARAMHWPIHFSRQHGLKNTLWASWSLVEGDREGWTLHYSGPWEGRGANFSAALPEVRLPVTVQGEGEGDVRVSRSGQVLRHRFSWWREVTQVFPGATVVQTQRFSGALERLP
jgi:hypothetical protein